MSTIFAFLKDACLGISSDYRRNGVLWAAEENFDVAWTAKIF